MAAALIRAKASRPSYRRAGLVLSSTAWLEIDPRDLGEHRLGALAGDPVVLLQGQDEGVWRDIPAEVRAAASAALADPSEPSPLIDGGPSWADVEAAREETARLSADLIGEFQGQLGLSQREVELQRDLVTKALAEITKVKGERDALQKQVDGLKASLAAAKPPKGKPAPATEKGPADPPAADQA